ncbi:MAG: hypothetical protein IT518_22250 [Burkholderiales bacterium]|nr:hypothetical protein [Burkholderiales bacterium]
MPATRTRLGQSQLANSIATLYTVPANSTLVDQSMYFWNDDSSQRIVTVQFVPSGQSPGADYYILESFSIYPKTGILVQPKQAIATGGTIRGFADVAAKVSCHLSGLIVNTTTDTTIVTRLAQLQLAAALATVYTVGANPLADQALWLYNFDTASRTVQVQFVPNGQSPALDYTILNSYVLQPKTGIAIQPGQVIGAGGTIRANADVANKVTFAATGLQL